MTEITVVSFLLNFFYFLIGALGMIAMLRFFDRLTTGGFDEARDQILSEPKAAAIYYGARLIAVAILGAAFVGA